MTAIEIVGLTAHYGELVTVDTVAALRDRIDTDRTVVLTVANAPADRG